MIVQLRIDERLIHGQITTAWSRYLDVSRIVVASDKLAKDPLTTQTLLMSAPAGKKVAVKTIPDAIKLLSDPRVDTVRVRKTRSLWSKPCRSRRSTLPTTSRKNPPTRSI